MPDGFTKPPSGAAGLQVPRPVELKEADPERRKMYGRLAGMDEGPDDGSELAGKQEPGTEIEETQKSDLDDIRLKPTDGDKKAFVRALMSGGRYVKKIPLFGAAMTATFSDRTVAISEKIFLAATAGLTAEEQTVRVDRYMLAAQLTALDGAKIDSIETTDADMDVVERNLAKILALPRPLYHALMTANREFEEHVEYLTMKANEPDFWHPGGLGSSSTLVAPGR